MQSSPSEADTLLQTIHDTWSRALAALGSLEGTEDDARGIREAIESSQAHVDRYLEIERGENLAGLAISEGRTRMLDSIRDLHLTLATVLESELHATDRKRQDLGTMHRALRGYASPERSGQYVTGDA